MKRMQMLKHSNKDTNTDTDNSSAPVSNSVVVKLMRMTDKCQEERPTQNEQNSNTSDFEQVSDPMTTGEAESESESEFEYGSDLSMSVERSSYGLRSKNPLGVEVNPEDDDDGHTKTSHEPIKLQQPPVYINTHLMKIKMESDYIPIFTVKQELSQDVNSHDNENEQEQIEQTSSFVSVPSSTNASKIHSNLETKLQSVLNTVNGPGVELNYHEIQYIIKCIQSFESRVKREDSEIPKEQQQQEEEEEKVVKNLSNLIKTQNMETEAVEKLEEEIQKYSKRVIFLVNEKAEIQTTLQNKIDQLNLIIGELKAKVLDLNSANKKNSEEQKGTEKLKNNLKSSEKISKSIKNPILKTEPNQSQELLKIRDLPAKVLLRIFGHLDMKSVKESRLVCRQWKNEAGKTLLQNFYLVCDDNKKECKKSLQNWLTNSKVIAQKLLAKDGKMTLQLLQKTPGLKISIRELKNVQSDTESLYKILTLLQNLEVLETQTLDLSPQQKWLTQGNGQRKNNKIPKKLQLLLQKLKTLNKLKLDFSMTKDNARDFLWHPQQFAFVKNMELHADGMNFLTQFKRNHFYNWRVTRFTLDIEKNYNVDLIRSFLLRISPSLRHLKFIVKSLQNEASSSLLSCFDPWTDDWIIPLGLNRVETLEIQQASDTENFIVKCIFSALQLPLLKKLTVPFIPEELEEIIHKWNSHESADGRKLESKSLEELEILPPFPTSSLTLYQPKIPGQLWPELKSLKCSWKNSKSFHVSFLSELENLERLELNILKWDPDKNGMQKDDNEANVNRNPSEIEFQLRDLKKLTSFCLTCPENEERSQDFANFLVEKDLKFMKGLQYVQFRRVVIGAEPLKSALGPHVSIIFIP